MTSKLATPFNYVVNGRHIQVQTWPSLLESFIVTNQHGMVIEALAVINDVSAAVGDTSIGATFRRSRCASGRLFELSVMAKLKGKYETKVRDVRLFLYRIPQ